MEISDILELIDPVDFYSQFTELEQRGEEYWGLSPFKDEKTPSFSVRPSENVFYDFSVGFGGNAIDFLERYYDEGFIDALNRLKKYANITDENGGYVQKRLVSTGIAKKFRKTEKERKPMGCQRLSDNYMDRYEFNLDKLKPWIDEGMTLETLRRFEVRYDSFSNRIVFPIRDYAGDIINISGRTLDPLYKEHGLRKYTYFKQFGGSLDTIYGFSDNKIAIDEKKEIILFEGAKSVMIADSWGVKNTGAILTSHLNPQQFLFLAKIGYRVVFALDKDVNIRDDKQIQRLKRYVNVSYLYDSKDLLTEKMSPVDNGEKVFRQLYEERRCLR